MRSTHSCTVAQECSIRCTIEQEKKICCFACPWFNNYNGQSLDCPYICDYIKEKSDKCFRVKDSEEK